MTDATKIVACLSWYDERPEWLAECVASVAPFASHVVAVDGAYGTWPGGQPHSHPDQAAAIRRTAEKCGMGCTIHEPDSLWFGDEPQKRSFALALAESVEGAEWVFSIDADEWVTEVGDDLTRLLTDTACDVGKVNVNGTPMVRRMFRAGNGVRSQCRLAYVTAFGGRQLASREQSASPEAFARLEAAVELPIVVHGRGNERPWERQQKRSRSLQLAYEFNLYPDVTQGHDRPVGVHPRCCHPGIPGARCERTENHVQCSGGGRHYTQCPLAQAEIAGRV